MQLKEFVQTYPDYYQTLCEEAKILLSRQTGSHDSLFKLMVLTLLLSNRISLKIGMQAFKIFDNAGLTDPLSLIECSTKELVMSLKRAGYGRYAKRTSRYLQYNAWLVLTRYAGDMRNLFKIPKVLRRTDNSIDKSTLLNQIKTELACFRGIGPVGTMIFLSELQAVYSFIAPQISPKAITNAKRLKIDLNNEYHILKTRKNVGERALAIEFAKVVAALSRVSSKDTTIAMDT